MTLLEAIQSKQEKPCWIPNTAREDLPELFKQLGFKKGIEIGVSWAQNIIPYCEMCFEIYGIDPWQDSDDNVYRKIISIAGKHARTVDTVYEFAKERTAPYPNCHLIRKLSMDAALDFPRDSLDFAYIDGNHSYGYVAMDLQKWTDRVRKGGIVAGHDYYSHKNMSCIRQVSYAVDGFIAARNIDNLYILGSKNPAKGEKQDRELSFMFIKR